MDSLDPLEPSDQTSQKIQADQTDNTTHDQANQAQPFVKQGQPCPDAGNAFAAFADTIAALRAPGGCPWDREQTHTSIAHNMIEEAYEAVDAIEHNDIAHLREELGDVLLQVVLQSQIASDAGEFTVAEVCRDVNEKMIRRHPHVFGDKTASSSGEVLDIWDSVKNEERNSANSKRADKDQNNLPP